MPPSLRVSVFNPEEVRQALAGGANAIDCEDPRAEVGMFDPSVITEICFAIRQTTKKLIRTSANIGFSLGLFEKVEGDRAVARSESNVQAKAAQAALGLAAAMDVGDHRANVVKFGVDGLHESQVAPVVSAVANAVKRSSRYRNHQVIAAFIVNDNREWLRRKRNPIVIRQLLEIGEYFFSATGPVDLNDYFPKAKVRELMRSRSTTPRVRLIDPFVPTSLKLPLDLDARTRKYVDLIRKADVDGIMIDTSVQAKSAQICLLDVPENRNLKGGLMPHGIYKLDILERFGEYCAFHGLEAWLAGSIEPYHAALLARIPGITCLVCRGSVSDVVKNPYGGTPGTSRFQKRISAAKVTAMAHAIQGDYRA